MRSDLFAGHIFLYRAPLILVIALAVADRGHMVAPTVVTNTNQYSEEGHFDYRRQECRAGLKGLPLADRMLTFSPAGL